MAETFAPSGVPEHSSTSRIDTILSVVIWVMAVGVVGFGAYFGYTVWATQQAELSSTPALRAINELKRAVRQEPNSVPLRVRLGEALGTAGLVDEAVEQLTAASRLDPTHTGAWLDLGLLAVDREEYKRAEGYFQKVVELTEGSNYQNINERRETALYYLGLLAHHDKRFEDAIAFYKAALRIRQDASDTYYHMSLSYQALEQPESALQQLDVALAFDPNYAQAVYQKGLILKEQGEDFQALGLFMKASTLAPGADVPAEAAASFGRAPEWLTRAQAARAADDLGKAEHDVLMALRLEPEHADAWSFYLSVLDTKGATAKALASWKAALKNDPKDPLAAEAVERLTANAK